MKKKATTKSEKMRELDKLSFKQVFKMFNKENKGRYVVKVNK